MNKRLIEIFNPYSKTNTIASIAILVVFIFWFLLPKILIFDFDKIYKGKYFTIYSNIDLDKSKINFIINKIDAKLNRCQVEEKKYSDVIFIDKYWLFCILTPFNTKGFATNNVILDVVIVNNPNIENNTISKIFPLDALIAHEVTHSIIDEKVDFKPSVSINEGYCEHIAFGDFENEELLKNYYIDMKYYNYLIYYRKNINKTSIKDFNYFLQNKL